MAEGRRQVITDSMRLTFSLGTFIMVATGIWMIKDWKDSAENRMDQVAKDLRRHCTWQERIGWDLPCEVEAYHEALAMGVKLPDPRKIHEVVHPPSLVETGDTSANKREN